jgi:hypothetical protein
MEQRRLRLGDILDDYCPRERRVTNHAIVAMIEDDVKQTRCTTCDAEHVYKGGRAPQRRRKDLPVHPALAAAAPTDSDELDDMPEHDSAAYDEPTHDETVEETAAPEPLAMPQLEDGPVHRPLIRATLPRPEGVQKEARPMPEFTVRQPGTRGGNGHGHFRGAGRGGGNMARPQGNGGRPHGRFRPGRGGATAGFRSGPPRQGGGKKRSR